MKVSLKAKLTALISLLVLFVVLAISTLYLSNLVQQALSEIGDRGQYVANEIYSQARDILADSHMPAGADPKEYSQLRAFVANKLSNDAGLTTLLQSSADYSATVYYVGINDAEGQAMVHYAPNGGDRPCALAAPFGDLTRQGLPGQLKVIYGPQASMRLFCRWTSGTSRWT